MSENMQKVKYLKFLEVFEDDTKLCKKIPSSEYLKEGAYQIIDQGQNDIAGYTYDSTGLYTDTPVIIFGDHTRVIKYVDKPFFIGADGVKVLKSKIDTFNTKYLYYALLNAKIPNTGYNRHFKWLKEVKIAVASPDAQRKIVSTLSEIENIIGKRKRQLEKLDELIKSKFTEMFGDIYMNSFMWETSKLSKHLNIIGGFAFKSEKFRKKGIPVLRIGNINLGYFNPTNLVYYDYNALLSKYIVKPGELVISLTGTVGKDDYANICMLKNDFDIYYLNQRNAKLELFKTLNKYYLINVLRIPSVKHKLTNINRGVRQANVSNNDILNLEIPIPPIELQNQFADFVEKVEAVKSKVKQSLAQLEMLKKSLMQKYFG